MRRAKGYQDLDENVGDSRIPSTSMPPPQEIEMASVSVVPDGNFLLFALHIFKLYIVLFKINEEKHIKSRSFYIRYEISKIVM